MSRRFDASGILGTGPGVPGVARALGCVVAFVLYLGLLGLEPGLHTDTARDLTLARHGLETGEYLGCNAAFGSIVQGALFPRVLGLALATGIGVFGAYVGLLAATAASLVIVHESVRRYLDPALAVRTTVAQLPLTLIATGHPNLWNPILAPIGVAILFWAQQELAARGQVRAAVGCGLGLWLAAEGHVSAGLAAPMVAFLVAVHAARPAPALLAFGVAAALPAWLASRTSIVTNLAALAHEPRYLDFVFVGMGICVAAATLLAPRMRARPSAERARDALRIGGMGLVAQLAAGSWVAGRVLASPQYLLPAIPACAYGLAWLSRRWAGPGHPWPRRALAFAPIGLAFGFTFVIAGMVRGVALSPAASMPGYTGRDVERIAAAFMRRGITLHDLARHLRGPHAAELFAGIAPFATDPDRHPERRTDDLRVVALARDQADTLGDAEDGMRVDLARGRVAVVLPIAPWVRPAPARVCLERPGAPPECVAFEAVDDVITGRFADLPFPAIAAVRTLLGGRDDVPPGTTVRWELTIVPTGEDAIRHVDLVGLLGSPWKIVGVEGLPFEGMLPARAVTLGRGSGGTGRMVLRMSGLPFRYLTPDYVESRPDESALRRVVRALPRMGATVCARLDTCPP